MHILKSLVPENTDSYDWESVVHTAFIYTLQASSNEMDQSLYKMHGSIKLLYWYIGLYTFELYNLYYKPVVIKCDRMELLLPKK
mgnify:CR=1 FL=1